MTNLLPNWNASLTFYWNTTGMFRGNYTIKAVASTVPGETNTENNVFTDGSVQVLWHDVSVVSVASDRNWVFQRSSTNVSVTIKNNGDFTETVAVTLYYNITDNKTIGTQNATLLAGESKTLQFTWNATSVPYCYSYTLTAVATIPADNNPADNTLSDGNVKVRIIGDLNGDGRVDGRDISLAAWSFGATPGSLRWNPDVDINPDGKIDGKDLTLIARNFGASCIP